MSDDKPFAEIKPETSIPDAEGFSVVVEGEELCPPWGNWAESGANDYAAKINAAVERERREAAALALRKAANDAGSYAEDTMEHLGHQEGLLADAIRLRVVRWLLSRAADIEGGAPCSPTSP